VKPRALIPIAAVFAALVSGCGHAPGYPPDPVPRPTAVTDFASLYSQNCAACHGANGQDGPAIDLANPVYQALIDDATLRKSISGGMPGTEMPAFAQSQGGMLTDAQVDALVAGMRQEWSRRNAFAGATPPPYAETQAGDPNRGQQVYGARCAGCHQNPQKQQITSTNYLSLVSDQALRTIIIAGRSDIGQPDWRLRPVPLPGERPVVYDYAVGPPLSAGDVDDIVAYLGSLRGPAAPTQAANAAPNQSVADGRQTK
jgi:cytochrome c oxidase cbb3-type subunit III